MPRNHDALTQTHFDLVVVGGGIFGACAALDAAQRGLKVALLERGDFGGATSANSLKMVHGGIRYVQHLDIPRVRHSAAERRIMLRVAPHLVAPLPVVVPTYGHGMKGKEALRVGFGLYDLLTLDCNRGITDPSRRIPWCGTLRRDRVLQMFPDIKQDGLTGAGVFSDAQMHNPCRLVTAFLLRGVRLGAVAVNHCEVTAFLREGDAVTGVAARDRLTGKPLEVKAKMVLNAAGPYAERLLAQPTTGIKLKRHITYSRDTAFVVKRSLAFNGHAVALQGTTLDPDARVGRGQRHMFIAPWRKHYTLIGVWHGVYKGDPFAFNVTDRELRHYLDEINAIHPAWKLKLEDIEVWNAGLVPFGDNPDDASHDKGDNLRYGHRSHLIDHKADHNLDNLVTLIGVRYTTGRYEAARAVDLIYKKLGLPPVRSRTARTPVVGGDVKSMDTLIDVLERKYVGRVSRDACHAVARNYGSESFRLLGLIDENPDLAEVVGDTTLLAEVVHAVREEMALTLGDVVFRRTDLATGCYPGRAALEKVAWLMAPMLGWSGDDVERQMDEVAARFPVWAVRRMDGKAPTGAAHAAQPAGAANPQAA